MADEQTTTENEAPATGAAAYTDEQLSEAFPGQDLGHVRSMLDKQAGVGTPVDPNAEGETRNDTTPAAQEEDAGGRVDGDSGDTGGDESTVEYPDYIPEKFRTGTVEEAMAKLAESYKHLEGARGGDDDTGAAEPDAAADSGDGDAEPPAKVDLQSMEQRFVKNGNKISQDMYDEAAKAGLDAASLDQYIAGQQAIANQLITQVHEMVGGPETYEAMMKWMVGNMDAADIEAYDDAMGTGNQAKIAMAVRATNAAYIAAVGQDANTTVDPQNGEAAKPGFQSKREMIDAMRDPRYQKDPAYRKEVERKIATGSVW